MPCANNQVAQLSFFRRACAAGCEDAAPRCCGSTVAINLSIIVGGDEHQISHDVPGGAVRGGRTRSLCVRVPDRSARAPHVGAPAAQRRRSSSSSSTGSALAPQHRRSVLYGTVSTKSACARLSTANRARGHGRANPNRLPCARLRARQRARCGRVQGARP